MEIPRIRFTYWDSINPENWYEQEARFPVRGGAPPESAADEVAFAIFEKLLLKDIDRNIQELRTQLAETRRPPKHDYFSLVTMGIVLTPTYVRKKDWMHDVLEPEASSAIEDAFEGFIEKVEWEDE